MEWVTDERCQALFLGGTIVGGCHHPKRLARREQGVNLRRTSVQILLNEAVQ